MTVPTSRTKGTGEADAAHASNIRIVREAVTEHLSPLALMPAMVDSRCVRCGEPFPRPDLTTVTGWDPRGIICRDCWYQDAKETLDAQRMAEWEYDRMMDRRECEG